MGTAHRPYISEAKRLLTVILITSGTLRDSEALPWQVEQPLQQSIDLTTLNIDITNSIMVCGQCPPYWRDYDGCNLESLGEDLLDFTQMSDLLAWLDAH